MHKLLFVLLILFFIPGAYSATNLTIELSTHLGNKNTNIDLNYQAENIPSEDILTISAIKCDIGHYLHCGRTTGLEKIFILNKTINSETGSLSFNLNLEPWFYNICAELEKTINGDDCTTNYFILQDNEIIEKEVIRYVEPEKEILVSLINYPTKLKSNQEFEIIANITNNLNYDINISYYSYVYNGSKLYSFGEWTGNKKEATIPAFSAIKIFLTNKIKEDVNEGMFNLKLRIKYNNKDYDIITQVLITNEKPIINISYIKIHEKTFDVAVSNIGTSEGEALLLLYNNGTFIKKINMKPKFEETFRFPINSSEINIFLIKENNIENKKILIEPTDIQENKEVMLNNTPNEIQNITIQIINNNILTGQIIKNEKPFISYPVLVSLMGIVMLVIFIWSVKVGKF